MRGIIADCNFSGNSNTLNLNGGINPLRLRQYLLYWDKIDYPSNNIVYIKLSEEEKYLETVGILQRTHVNFYSDGFISVNPDIFINAQLHASEKDNQNQGEIWSLTQNNCELYLPDEMKTSENVLQFELHNCLPVPSGGTSLDGILKFKAKRQNELIALRKALDAMYDTIIDSQCSELQKQRCIEELQSIMVDVNKATKESFAKRFLSSLNIEIRLPQSHWL